MEIALKYKLVEKLIQTEDDTILNEIKELLGLSNTDFWHELPTHVKAQINKAKEQLDNGLGISNQDVMAEVEKRFL